MIKTCAVCGKEFETRVHNAKYCCPDCRAEASKKLQREADKRYRARHKKERAAKSIIIKPEQDALALRRLDGGESICMWCEKPVADLHQHFCSDDCLLRFYAKKFSSLAERGL